jgi:hypothetical protein
MSNATQESQNSGENRRRRSRGGSNRNRNQNRQGNREGDRNGDRNSNQGRRQGGQRSEEFRPQASRPARKYAPAKLTLWQKILKALGLYKEPAPPSRKQESIPFPESRAPKSNTRNARSGEGEARAPRQPRNDGERPPRNEGERPPRGEGERTRGANRNNERSRGGDPKSVESTRVYVGNLSYDVTEQDLQELFKGIGGVRNIEVVYNRSTHRSKGYGFVEMLRMDEAVRAVEVLNDQPFMGRNMTVSGAKSKGHDEREDSEGRTEREPIRPVLASTMPAVIATEEPAAVAVEPAVAAEPVTETIVESVVESVVVVEETVSLAAPEKSAEA